MKKEKTHVEAQNRIAIALGDPAGIGIEITLKALGDRGLPKDMHPLLVGCKENLQNTYDELIFKGITGLANPSNLEIENIPLNGRFIFGEPNKISGQASFQWLTHAAKLIIEGKAKALVTAPIAKHAWHEAGYSYPGQTERQAELVKTENASKKRRRREMFQKSS